MITLYRCTISQLKMKLNASGYLRKIDNLDKKIDTNLDKCRLIMNNWLKKDITIFCRIVLTKVESLSRNIYPCFSLAVSAKKISYILISHRK